jgi:glycosyltransferase involved in cell wall biosynthesis
MYKMLTTVEQIDHRVGSRVTQRPPRVSVIIPAHNVSEFISETLDSVLTQTYQDYEIILVNDGSDDTPDLEKILEDYFDQIIYVAQPNGGASSARNTAIGLARGEILAFVDGDDAWLPDYLSKQVEFFDAKGLDMAYCDAYLVGGPPSDGETFMELSGSHGPVSTVSLINWKCNVITSGTIASAEAIRNVGPFDLRMHCHQDFDMWFRLAKGGAKIGYQREILLKYRVRPNGVSGNNVRRAERNISSLIFLKEKYELSPDEQDALEQKLTECQALLSLETAKSCIVRRDYEGAARHLDDANRYYKKVKLSLLLLLLRIYPSVERLLFMQLKRHEIAYYQGGSV